MKITLGKEHRIGKFCDDTNSRYAIANVNVNFEQNRLEALDGKMLITVPIDHDGTVPATDHGRHTLLEGKALDEVLTKTNGKPAVLTTEGEGQAFSVSADTKTGTRVVVDEQQNPGRFPNCNDILDDFDKGNRHKLIGKCDLNAALFKKIVNYAIAESADDNLRISFTIYDDAVAFEINTESGKARGVLMGLMPKR